ncbi:MAG: YlxR family protein [Gaiellaceae bacterium]
MSAPTRTCVGCGRKAPQRELVRFAAPTGVLEVDRGQRLAGRGAYTCPRPSCFEKATARRAFARTLRRTVTIPSGLKASIPEE